jgi:hypothetical protein
MVATHGVFANQLGKFMKPDFPKLDKAELPEVDQDRIVSPHAQEVECALILSQMINKVKSDPSQMRLAIYEFARARLQIDTSWADEAEKERFSAALERAIDGVEGFSARQDEKERLQPSPASALLRSDNTAAGASPTTTVAIRGFSSAPEGMAGTNSSYWQSEAQPIIHMHSPLRFSTLARFLMVVLLFCAAAAGLLVYNQRSNLLRLSSNSASSTILTDAKPTPSSSSSPAVAAIADTKTAAPSSGAPSFPLPSDYGVYVLENGALSELRLLEQQVPDKRVAMSAPLSQPSRTTLPDGKARFVVFRRDLAANAPDRMDVRAVARVVRALTFDIKGKPNYSSVSDAWNIRNVSYQFRVRPVAGNPEMLLVQAEKADFALPPGRYVLVLKTEGYDFTVAGKITDPAQCLERTDAANGEFYSECQK